MTNLGRTALNAAMTRLVEGDRQAGREIFDMLWPLLRAFCARTLRGSEQAEDVAQRSLIKIFEQASLYDPRRDALAWVLEIAFWECRTERRRRFRAREGTWSKALEEKLIQPASAEAQIEQQQLRAAIDGALSALPQRDRETLLALLAEATAPVAAATWRKRKERALARFRLTWRSLYGTE